MRPSVGQTEAPWPLLRGAGLGSFLEVLDAQSALLTASTQLVSARLAAWEARASFDRALGRGLEP